MPLTQIHHQVVTDTFNSQFFLEPILFILKPFSTQTTDHTEPMDRTASVSAEPAFVGLNARFSTG